jgi:hypothetical protein
MNAHFTRKAKHKSHDMFITGKRRKAGEPYLDIECDGTGQAKSVKIFVRRLPDVEVSSYTDDTVQLTPTTGNELTLHRTACLILAQYGHLPPDLVDNYERQFSV